MENSSADRVREPFHAPLALPEEMRVRDQWVAWRLETRVKPDGEETHTKVLYDPRYTPNTQAKARTNDSSTWGTFEQAVVYAQNAPGAWGVGFVIHKDDPYVIVDFDHCWGEDGEMRSDVRTLIDEAGSFAEVSQSGKGGHLVLRGTLAHLVPDYGRVVVSEKYPEGNDVHYGSRDAAFGMEIYGGKRFIAMTGRQLDGTPNGVVENQAWIDSFYTRLFGHRVRPQAIRNEATAGLNGAHAPRTHEASATSLQGPFNALSDEDLVTKALSSTGDFAELWHDRPVNTKAGMSMGASEKRLVLASKLSFWCGPDEDRILRIISASPLYANYPDPDKFERDLTDYVLPRVIGERLAVGEWYGSKAPIVTGGAQIDEAQLDQCLATKTHDDFGLADRLIARHGHDLRYCEAEATWYAWDGQVWARQTTAAAAIRMGEDTVEAMSREVDSIPEKLVPAAKTKTVTVIPDGKSTEDPTPAETVDQNRARRDAYRSFIKASRSRRKINDMVGLAQTRSALQARPVDFDADPWLVTVANGTLDLKTATLRPHSRADRLTQALPVVYDPDATAPVWETFLARVLPDPDVRSFLQRFLGYSLTGLTKEQVFLFFYGSGANGKGTVVDTIGAMMGSLHNRLDAEVIAHVGVPGGKARFGLSGIVGRRLVTFGELEERSRFNEALLKSLTGEDPIEIELKGKTAYSYQPRAKYILAGNHKPAITGTDYGIWRRTRLVPFEVTISDEEKDLELRDKLLNELPGVLNWALMGLKDYQEIGLAAPAAVLEATQEYRKDSDVLGQFLDDIDNVVKGEGLTVRAQVLYTCYSKWCEENGHRTVLAQNALSTKLRARSDIAWDRDNKGTYWIGIAIVAKPTATPDDRDAPQVKARPLHRAATPAPTDADDPGDDSGADDPVDDVHEDFMAELEPPMNDPAWANLAYANGA